MGEGANATVRGLLATVGLVAVFLGMIAGAVFAFDDEALFVAPPENVAGHFLESLAFGRAGPARRLLSRDAERATSVEELLRVSANLRRRYGTVEHVDTQVDKRMADTVIVRAAVKGSRASGEFHVSTVRERGEWAVARPNELLQ